MRLASLAFTVAMSVATGCGLFTGSTDGYSLRSTGTADASGTLLQCASAADCPPDGGGTQVCCLGVGPSQTSLSQTCQAPPCTGPLGPVQLCKTNAECGDAGACTTQQCSLMGFSGTIQACGAITDCSPSR